MNDSQIKKDTMVLGNGFLAQCFNRNGFKIYGRKQIGSVEQLLYKIELLKDLPEFKNAKYIINCIGKSDTRYCENRNNFKEVLNVNGMFTKILSELCACKDKKFIHISTGCLYENTNGKKKEDDLLETHCIYTTTKLVGELNCDISRDIIIRPRLLFDNVHSNKNLLSKFLRFKKFLNEFNTITSNQTIVESVLALIKNNCSGVYNVGNLGTYTICEMAEAFGINVTETIQQEDLIKSQGLYLVNNVMDMSKLIKDTSYIPKDALSEIREYAI